MAVTRHTDERWVCEKCHRTVKASTLKGATRLHDSLLPTCPYSPNWLQRVPAPRDTELWDALEAFAMARHRISAREGTVVSKYPEDAIQLAEAHNRIIDLFAARSSANSVRGGQQAGVPAPPSVAERAGPR